MLDLFNLQRPVDRVRHGTDAVLLIDGHTLEFELKSVTTGGGLTTVRDFGPDHIVKWKNKHWLISVYQGSSLLYCKYGSPAAMAPWIEEKWRYIEADFELAKCLPWLATLDTMYSIVGRKSLYSMADARKLHNAQYSAIRYKEPYGHLGCCGAYRLQPRAHVGNPARQNSVRCGAGIDSQ